jgi:uncharacterized membrane protein YfcA
MLLRYRSSMRVAQVLPLILMSIVGVPTGIFLLRHTGEASALAALGVVLIAYALYALSGFRLPRVEGKAWALGTGFIGGVLGGAYNTPGPPMIMYADCRRWPPDVFKGNLQAFFVQNSVIVLIGHWLSGNLTAATSAHFLSGLPWLAGGLVAGLAMDRWISPEIFRKVVLVLLVIMGLRLVF